MTGANVLDRVGVFVSVVLGAQLGVLGVLGCVDGRLAGTVGRRRSRLESVSLLIGAGFCVGGAAWTGLEGVFVRLGCDGVLGFGAGWTFLGGVFLGTAAGVVFSWPEYPARVVPDTTIARPSATATTPRWQFILNECMDQPPLNARGCPHIFSPDTV